MFFPSWPKGWISQVIFEYIVINIIIKFINRRRQFMNMLDAPALLLTDGHGSRESPEVFYQLIANNIFLVCEEPHTSGQVSPNDQSINARCKNVLSDESYDASDNAAERRGKFMQVAMQAIGSASLHDTQIKSYNDAGIYPPNPWIPLAHTLGLFTMWYTMGKTNNEPLQWQHSVSGKILTDPDKRYSLDNLHTKHARSKYSFIQQSIEAKKVKIQEMCRIMRVISLPSPDSHGSQVLPLLPSPSPLLLAPTSLSPSLFTSPSSSSSSFSPLPKTPEDLIYSLLLLLNSASPLSPPSTITTVSPSAPSHVSMTPALTPFLSQAEDREGGADSERDKGAGGIDGTSFHTSSIARPAGSRSADFTDDLLAMLQSLLLENRKETGVCVCVYV
jgi:hypothetical protein